MNYTITTTSQSEPAMFASRRKLLLLLIILVLIAALVSVILHKRSAPDVQLVTLSGKTISLRALRSQMVLVNFWATSCSTCVSEMPDLASIYKAYQAKGLEVIAIAMPYDPPEHVSNFSKQHALPFPVALDVEGKASAAFGTISLTPTSFLIDQHGHVVSQIIGRIDFAELKHKLDQSLIH